MNALLSSEKILSIANDISEAMIQDWVVPDSCEQLLADTALLNWYMATLLTSPGISRRVKKRSREHRFTTESNANDAMPRGL